MDNKLHKTIIEKTLLEYTGSVLTDVQVRIVVLAHNKLIEAGSHYGETKNYTSFNYLHTYLTGKKIDIRKNGSALRYMAAVTKEAITPLVEMNVLTQDSLHYSKDAHIARKLTLTDEFAQLLETEMKNCIYEALGSPTTASIDNGKALGWQKDLSRYMDITIATKKKWEASTVRLNLDAIVQLDTSVLSKPQLHNLLFGLSTIALTDKDQKQGRVGITDAGRLFTIGGIMNLPRGLRKKILRPRPGYSIVDFDLESAQLKLMAQFLNADFYNTLCELKTSVWEYLDMPFKKDVVKKALYAFVFGSLEGNIVEHVKDSFPDTEFNEESLQLLLSKLGDLPQKRAVWFRDHKKAAILAMPIKDRRNALGMVFRPEDAETNIQGKFFAHLMQGLEQFIIQSLIANKVNAEQMVVCYDGFLLEVKSGLVEQTLKQYNEYVGSLIKGMKIKAEVLAVGETHEEVPTSGVQSKDINEGGEEGRGSRGRFLTRRSVDADGWNRRECPTRGENEAQRVADAEISGLLQAQRATNLTPL